MEVSEQHPHQAALWDFIPTLPTRSLLTERMCGPSPQLPTLQTQRFPRSCSLALGGLLVPSTPAACRQHRCVTATRQLMQSAHARLLPAALKFVLNLLTSVLLSKAVSSAPLSTSHSPSSSLASPQSSLTPWGAHTFHLPFQSSGSSDVAQTPQPSLWRDTVPQQVDSPVQIALMCIYMRDNNSSKGFFQTIK